MMAQNIGNNLPIRKKDLSSRERVNFVVDSSIMSQLREEAERKNIPMSRIIDSALAASFGDQLKNNLSNISEIVTMHLLVIYIYLPNELHNFEKSDIFIAYDSIIHDCFERYIYTPCLIWNSKNRTNTFAVKFQIYLSDRDQAKLSNFLSILTSQEEKRIKIVLDGKEQSF